MKKLILTALDNNHKLWYEHFIPFILSLRETNYNGDIAVIDYGLSEAKKRRLEEQSIRLYPAANHYNDLIIDRHYSIAEIAKQEEFDYLAIYDADIWFPYSKLTIFEQIRDDNNLYCTYDLWYCTFLSNCVKNYGVDKVHRELSKLIQENGFVWQAGVIAGYRAAWIDYQNYMEKMLSKEGDFSISYGIDATILNLYSVHTNKISYLDKKYNCPLAWGIRLTGDQKFTVDHEVVEGIHLTRAHRDNPHFNYIRIKSEHYYEEGRKFSEKGQQVYSIRKESLTKQGSGCPLQVVEVFTNGRMVIGVDRSRQIFPEESVVLEVAGYSKVLLRNPLSESLALTYARTSILNMEESENVSVILGGRGAISSDKNRSFQIILQPNQEITFITKDLDIQKGMKWIFRNIYLVE